MVMVIDRDLALINTIEVYNIMFMMSMDVMLMDIGNTIFRFTLSM